MARQCPSGTVPGTRSRSRRPAGGLPHKPTPQALGIFSSGALSRCGNRIAQSSFQGKGTIFGKGDFGHTSNVPFSGEIKIRSPLFKGFPVLLCPYSWSSAPLRQEAAGLRIRYFPTPSLWSQSTPHVSLTEPGHILASGHTTTLRPQGPGKIYPSPLSKSVPLIVFLLSNQ